MTREEAIKTLKGEAWICCFEKWNEALDMAIQALEQQPCEKYIKEIDHLRKYIYKLETKIVEQESCEDAISRQVLKDLGAECIAKRDENGELIALGCIDNLPSVSTEKTGHWIESNGVGMFICSVCNDSFYPMPTCLGKPLMKYCPTCGAKMEEVDG